MARTWLSIRVELVDGMHAPAIWPRPTRILLARPGMTFRMLADAIDTAFARWDRGHLHAFTLADGTRIALRGPWDVEDDELDDTRTTLSRLRLGEQFAYEFDFGDSWTHLCTVADHKVDPVEVYGDRPERPVPYWGWGDIPDQYGRRWDGDDGSQPLPAPPDPPLSDLPRLHPMWPGRPGRASETDADTIVVGPWPGPPQDPIVASSALAPTPWPVETLRELRSAATRGDVEELTDLLAGHEPLEVAHLVVPGLIDQPALAAEAPDLLLALLVSLRTRGWLGDDELADEIERAIWGGSPVLRPSPVDLDELASHLEGPPDPEGCLLEVRTGMLWPGDPWGLAGVEAPEGFDDPDAFLPVVALGSKPGHGDMQELIRLVTDEALADRLQDAIQGRGAFRRFKDVLAASERWWAVWQAFSQQRRLARARWWLADAGLRPASTEERRALEG